MIAKGTGKQIGWHPIIKRVYVGGVSKGKERSNTGSQNTCLRKNRNKGKLVSLKLIRTCRREEVLSNSPYHLILFLVTLMRGLLHNT